MRKQIQGKASEDQEKASLRVKLRGAEKALVDLRASAMSESTRLDKQVQAYKRALDEASSKLSREQARTNKLSSEISVLRDSQRSQSLGGDSTRNYNAILEDLRKRSLELDKERSLVRNVSKVMNRRLELQLELLEFGNAVPKVPPSGDGHARESMRAKIVEKNDQLQQMHLELQRLASISANGSAQAVSCNRPDEDSFNAVYVKELENMRHAYEARLLESRERLKTIERELSEERAENLRLRKRLTA